MNSLVLPERLERILLQDSALHSIVESTMNTFSGLLYNSKLYFFDEYTDHSSDHIQKVLRAVEDIITPESFRLLTPKDVTVIVLAVILHDIGMHTEYATFKSLVEDEIYDDVREPLIDLKSWSELWSDYIDEAKKFSSKQKVSIFGDSNIELERPSLERKGSLTEDNRKLIGEFLRRHHPRLAHEIAFKGITGSNGEVIEFAPNLPPLLRKLTAIVARSHGINIRDTYTYLKFIGDRAWKMPDQVNVVFLMVLIRVADYFQFGSDRVNPEAIKIKTFSSPVSLFEHNKHLSIDFIQPDTEDRETLFVKASPVSSLLYVKLKSLFKDIQDELDISWAVLGEIYGNFELDKLLKIKYRRINSNLTNTDFANSLPFVSDRIAFEADVDLPKLLIAPLYGNDPSYGVREMTQNAVDACRERLYNEKQRDLEYTPEIKIGLIKEGQDVYFIVRDNGKGMSLLELKNYFLKAGSSLRKSMDWKLKYTDESGKPQVQRNGKFGVGVLAAFLLGNKIYVETKGMHSLEGYSFEAEIDTEQIEISKRNDLPVGTFIKIQIQKNVIDSLNNSKSKIWYKWYTLASPSIEYVNETLSSFGTDFALLPSDSDYLPQDILAIRPVGFDIVMWTYNKMYGQRKLICNGILIPDESNLGFDFDYNDYENYYYNPLSFITQTPTISIFDYEGNLPLTLNRNEVDGDLSFKDDIVKDIYKDILACLLCYIPESSVNINNFFITSEYLYHPSFRTEQGEKRQVRGNLLFLRNGFVFNYESILNQITPKVKVRIFSKNNELNIDTATVIDDQYIFSLEKEDRIRMSDNGYITDPAEFWNSGGRVTMRKSDYRILFDNTKNRVRKGLLQNHRIDFENEDWISYSQNYSTQIDSSLIENIMNNDSVLAVKETDLRARSPKNELTSLFDKYLGKDAIIPYSMEERKVKFRKAFADLDKYCVKYLNVRQ